MKSFVEKMKGLDRIARTDDSREKEGVFTGGYANNPVNGDKIPVYTANFVLMEYGTGAVMAVPAHDQRDFEFAKKYDIPIKVVIQPKNEKISSDTLEAAYVEAGVMDNSSKFDGMDNEAGKAGVTELLEENGSGKGSINFRLRDWGISRQRYWGTPIPIIHCAKCGSVPVPESDLPVELPENIDFDAKALSPLAAIESFVNTECPTCGGKAKRETDTMDTFVESSWYYARYTSPRKTDGILDRDKADYWLSVDQYIGGIEHAVMHLLYSRFFHKVLRDLDLVSGDEPFKNLLTQGMVCMESMQCPQDGWLSPDEVEAGKCIKCDSDVIKGRTEKMSKSKKNTVDPDKLIGYFGADTARLFSLFAAPPEKDLEWNEAGVEGAYRFLNRVWRMIYERLHTIKDVAICSDGTSLEGEAKKLRRKLHQTIKKVTGDMGDRFHFNTAISAVMELVNVVLQFEAKSESDKEVLREAIEAVVLLICPIVPHISEELWQILEKDGNAVSQPWPKFDPKAAVEDEVTIVVQVNGKMRGKVVVSASSTDDEIKASAMADEKVARNIEGLEIRKVIVVPKKLVNIVVGK